MPPSRIVDYLEQVLAQEDIVFEKPALRLLADGANGSMRDALSLTDQAIAYTAGDVSLSAVRDMLGSLDQTYLVRILDGLATGDGAGLVAIADEMAARSLSYHSALRDLGVLINRIALMQTAPAALSEDIPEYEDICRLSKQFNAEDLQLHYQIAVHGRNELGLAPDEYAGFTMTLLRMLAFHPDKGNKPAEKAVKKPSAEEFRASGAGTPALAAKKASPPPLSPPVSPKAEDDSPPWDDFDSLSVVPNVSVDTVAVAAGLVTENAVLSKKPQEDMLAEGEGKPGVSVRITEWDENWPVLAEGLPLRGMAQQLAQQTELAYWKQTENGLHFHLRAPLEALCASTNVDKLAEALMNCFECPVKVTTELGKVGLTASQNAFEKREKRQHEAENAIHNDVYIQTLVHEFGASIVPGSIKPI
jgi:DNA polymerase-3 subunit gamma/tau